MNSRQQRFILNLIAGVFLIASLGIGALIFIPLPEPEVRDTKSAALPTFPNKDTRERKELDEFAGIWDKRLQRPLYDPPPKESVVEENGPEPVRRVAPPEDRLRLKLIGTVLEAGKSMAILADSTGTVTLRTIGEQWTAAGGELQLEEVDADRVVVRYDGEPVTLSLETP